VARKRHRPTGVSISWKVLVAAAFLLKVKGVQGTRGVFELSWAQDGRATWEYGEERLEGEAHIVWRRIGTHDIFKNP
jgi:hypothetical protein